MTPKELIAEAEAPASEAMKTCGACRHSKIPAPKMSRHKPPRVLQVFPGRCVYPVAPVPMVAAAGCRKSVWADYDATACPCFEAREVKP